MVPMDLDVTAIVLEGVQRVDEWRRIRKVIPSGEAIPVAIVELELDGAHIGPGARQILELVDDERTVEEIQLQTHSSLYHVSRVLFEQHQLGRLKIVKPRWKARLPEPEPAATAGVSGPALLKTAQGYLEAKDYEHALRYLRAARSLEPESKEIGEALKAGEKSIREEIERSGVTLTSIPKLAVTMEQLTTSKLSPQEGFMMTRVNGTYDIQSIVKITPMPQLDALMVFWKLVQGGFLTMEAKKR